MTLESVYFLSLSYLRIAVKVLTERRSAIQVWGSLNPVHDMMCWLNARGSLSWLSPPSWPYPTWHLPEVACTIMENIS